MQADPVVLVQSLVPVGAGRVDIGGREHNEDQVLLRPELGLFVIAAAIHGAIGLRTVASEWLAFRGVAANATMGLIGVAIIMPVIIAYTTWAYWVFRGKAGAHGYH